MTPEDLNKCMQAPLFQHIEDIKSIEYDKSDEEFTHTEYCELCDNTTGYVYNHIPPTLYTGQEFISYGYDGKRVESGKRHIALYIGRCSVCRNVHAVILSEYNGEVIKIGQYPLCCSKFQKYKTFKKIYSDLCMADKAFAYGMGVAAIVYLRRCYENLVTQKANSIGLQFDSNDNFKDKVKKIRKQESEFLSVLDDKYYTLYSVLSDSAHSGSEKDALANYELCKTCLLYELGREVSEKQQAQKLAELAKLSS